MGCWFFPVPRPPFVCAVFKVYYGLDGLSKEKEDFFGCQGRVAPFGGCSSTVMDPTWYFFF